MDHGADHGKPYDTVRQLTAWAQVNWWTAQAEFGWTSDLELIPAPKGLAFTYWLITRFMDEEEVLHVNEILGNEEARAERARRNLEAALAMGVEVG